MKEPDNNVSLYQKVKNKFDLITSNNGQNWLLALNWLLVLEFFSAIIEYQFVESSKQFIIHIPNGLGKELLIAFMLVLFIWYSIYNLIFMKEEQFFIFTLYLSLCIYLLITNDLTLTLLVHNLNIFEMINDSLSFYMIFQLFLKFIIFYLIYKILIVLKNRNKPL